MIVGSAVKANTKPFGNTRPSASPFAKSPNTNCDPAFVKSRKRLTMPEIAAKRSYPGRQPLILNFRMNRAISHCSATPHPTVRQFTARRLVEHAAMIRINTTIPTPPRTVVDSMLAMRTTATLRANAAPATSRRSERSEETGWDGVIGV